MLSGGQHDSNGTLNTYFEEQSADQFPQVRNHPRGTTHRPPAILYLHVPKSQSPLQQSVSVSQSSPRTAASMSVPTDFAFPDCMRYDIPTNTPERKSTYLHILAAKTIARG
jgi:hypothetical protein